VSADLVDEVVAYLAPMVLGAGLSAVGDLGITTISAALHLPVTGVTVLEPLNDGDDVNVRITMSRAAARSEGD
jgi:diaminohydroxyphosphoribosylaminopyrimidine deaminase/5-amino-6-(5-phosphoribosylamino)uracil reductase